LGARPQNWRFFEKWGVKLFSLPGWPQMAFHSFGAILSVTAYQCLKIDLGAFPLGDSVYLKMFTFSLINGDSVSIMMFLFSQDAFLRGSKIDF
jgi:hypothetical protein